METPHRLEQPLRMGVVAEGAAGVQEQVHIPRAEDEAAAELERIFAGSMLPESGLPGIGARREIERPQHLQKRPAPEPQGAVGSASFIHEQGKLQAGLFAEGAGMAHVAETDCGNRTPGLPDGVLVAAQLRDMLPAEDSAVVPEKHQGGRTCLPQSAETDRIACRRGKDDAFQSGSQAAHDRSNYIRQDNMIYPILRFRQWGAPKGAK